MENLLFVLWALGVPALVKFNDYIKAIKPPKPEEKPADNSDLGCILFFVYLFIAVQLFK